MGWTPRAASIELGASSTVDVRPVWLLAASGLLAVLDGATEAGGSPERPFGPVPGWDEARALLIHGLSFRDLLADHLLRAPAGVPGDADGGRRWLKERDALFWRRLLAHGAVSGLAYYASEMEANAAVEAIRTSWPSPLPSLDDLLADGEWFREAVRAQVLTWPVAWERAAAFMEPGALCDALSAAL